MNRKWILTLAAVSVIALCVTAVGGWYSAKAENGNRKTIASPKQHSFRSTKTPPVYTDESEGYFDAPVSLLTVLFQD